MGPERARALLAGLPGMAAARLLRPLAEGPTNSTWLVEREGEHWVLRVDTVEAARLGLDRDRERAAAAAAAAVGLTVPYAEFDVPGGYCLRRYVPGHTLEVNDLDGATLDELAARLRLLHGLPGRGALFDPGAAARRYADQLGTAEAQRLAGQVARLQAGRPGPAAQPVLCHNDLVCTNLLRCDDGRLLLIDWEYAAPGDPWFDLAIVVQHHGLDAGRAQRFLAAWLGHPPAVAETARLADSCALYASLLALWNLRIKHR